MVYHCSLYSNASETMSKYKLQNAREISEKIAKNITDISDLSNGDDEELYEKLYEAIYGVMSIYDSKTLDTINTLL